uniref:Secreted protein n=1 Tax=Arundo donax TaxID=35708 RepID=A0A0A9FD04_ARUDO
MDNTSSLPLLVSLILQSAMASHSWTCCFELIKPPIVFRARGSPLHLSTIRLPIVTNSACFWTPLLNAFFENNSHESSSFRHTNSWGGRVPIIEATFRLRLVTTIIFPDPPIEHNSGLRSSSHLCCSSFHTSSRMSRNLFRPMTSCSWSLSNSMLSAGSHVRFVINSMTDLTIAIVSKFSDTQYHIFNSKCS